MEYTIKNKRLSDQVIDVVRTMIKDESFFPGDKFYSENELKNRLQVSRSSIREAVRILEASGEVSVIQGKGIFIAHSTGSDFDAFRKWLKVNKEVILDNYEVRMIVDPKAAKYAADRTDEDGIRILDNICSDFEEAFKRNDRSAMISADEMFHLQLARFSGNRTLYKLMEAMTEMLEDGWISSINIPSRAESTAAEHRKILYYIRSSDGSGAENAMLEHLQYAIEEIRSSNENSK